MRDQPNNLPQTFQMDIVEPLVTIGGSIFGIVLAVGWLLNHPTQNEIYKPTLLLVFCILFLFVGLLTPRKLDILEKDIIISYLAWKRTVHLDQVKSYTLDRGSRGRGGRRYFVTIKINRGLKISFVSVKEGHRVLLRALEKWTGFKPLVEEEEENADEEIEDVPGKDQEFRPPEPLSELTEQLIQKMFPPDGQMDVCQLLINQCGNNIYAHEHKDKYELEGLRFSVLKVSKGDIKKLHRAIKTANQDIRDIYAESGFMGERAEEKREKWVQSVLNNK